MSGQVGNGIDRNTICTVKLRAEQWEMVLNNLGKGPYEIVAPLIQSIVPQIMQNGEGEILPPGAQE